MQKAFHWQAIVFFTPTLSTVQASIHL
uniref:Uncharacterized protein n=1 Tax=Arundo donax TaxID=35708 RepID=A0A0A9GZU5_ARUDO